MNRLNRREFVQTAVAAGISAVMPKMFTTTIVKQKAPRHDSFQLSKRSILIVKSLRVRTQL
jgi:hypothetical protein